MLRRSYKDGAVEIDDESACDAYYLPWNSCSLILFRVADECTEIRIGTHRFVVGILALLAFWRGLAGPNGLLRRRDRAEP